MRKILLLVCALSAGLSIAQNNETNLSNWKNSDAEIVKSVFSKYAGQSQLPEELKKELWKSQEILKIEIINNGDWSNYSQNIWLRIVKVNDGQLEQVLRAENSELELQPNFVDQTGWRDEYGNLSFKSISEPVKISQEFISIKNEMGHRRTPLAAIETYQTAAPVYSFSFKIHTHKIDRSRNNSADLSKTVKIYADNQLIKTSQYSYEEVTKTNGISIREFKIDVSETN